MDDTQRAAIFLKAWARYTLALASAVQPTLRDLSNEPAAFQQVQILNQTQLATDVQRREVALQMALVEFQNLIESESRGG
jgi:hypothetical protein